MDEDFERDPTDSAEELHNGRVCNKVGFIGSSGS